MLVKQKKPSDTHFEGRKDQTYRLHVIGEKDSDNLWEYKGRYFKQITSGKYRPATPSENWHKKHSLHTLGVSICEKCGGIGTFRKGQHGCGVNNGS